MGTCFSGLAPQPKPAPKPAPAASAPAQARDKNKPSAIIFDTDVGYDDLMAAGILARAAPGPVKLVSVVHGMTPNNPDGVATMKYMFERLGGQHRPKIVSGAEVPIKPEHEKNGLASLDWGGEYRDGLHKWVLQHLGPKGATCDKDEALPATLQILRDSEDASVDIVAVGPLTNIAKLLTATGGEDLVRSKVRRVWVMGGALDVKGNADPGEKAELNFYADPEAARVVLGAPSLEGKLYVHGLDVCNRDDPRSDGWGKQIAGEVDSISSGVMASSQAANEDTFVYDPLVAYACVVNGRGFEYEDVRLEVGPLGDLKRSADAAGPSVHFAKSVPGREEYVKALLGWCSELEGGAYPPYGLANSVQKLPKWIQSGCGDKPFNCAEKQATFAPDGIAPAQMPDLSKHSSFMAEVLVKNPQIYDKLKDKKTKNDITLAHVIKTGVDNPGHPHIKTVGMTACDEESYETFKELFDPVIAARHGGYNAATAKQPTNLDIEQLSNTDIDPDCKYVLTTRVRTGRSIRGFQLPPTISFEERRKLEALCVKGLLNMSGELKGDYFPLSGSRSYKPKPNGMTQEKEEQLRKCGNLFQEPDSTLLLASGMGRHWPDGRGVFENEASNLFVWVGEEDHLRIVSMQGTRDRPTAQGKAIKEVVARFINACDSVQKVLKEEGSDFMHNEHLGWVLTCPSNLGTGLRAGTMVKLPKVSVRSDWKQLCSAMGLQARGTGGVDSASSGGTWDVSNADRIGKGEVELVNILIEGAAQLVKWEAALDAGEGERVNTEVKGRIEDKGKTKIGYIGSPGNLKDEHVKQTIVELFTELARSTPHIDRGALLYVGEPNKELQDAVQGVRLQDMMNAPVDMFDAIIITSGGPNAEKEAKRFNSHSKLYIFNNSASAQECKWFNELAAAKTFDLMGLRTFHLSLDRVKDAILHLEADQAPGAVANATNTNATEDDPREDFGPSMKPKHCASCGKMCLNRGHKDTKTGEKKIYCVRCYLEAEKS